MIKPARYCLGALLAATYWYATAWLCFALTGHDPIDLLTGAGSTIDAMTTIVVFCAAILVFALIGRRYANPAATP